MVYNLKQTSSDSDCEDILIRIIFFMYAPITIPIETFIHHS